MTINESGVLFVFPDEKVFHIEASGLYTGIADKGVCTVEMICLENVDTLNLIEAKTTCPNAENVMENVEKQRKYNEYFNQLETKYGHSLQMLSTVLLKRYTMTEKDLNDVVTMASLKDIKINLILVIKKAELLWLHSVKAELERRLLPIRKIWKADVIVLNEELAIQKKLAVSAEA